MDRSFTREQDELRDTVRRFLADRSPEGAVRHLMASADGYDPAVWKQLTEQLGLTAIAIPEQYGGAGYSYAELVIVFEEMGRALLCAPYFATVAMAANLLLATPDESAKRDFLPVIANGSVIATVALAEERGRWGEAEITLEATSTAAGWRLTGEKHYVVDGHTADLVLVVARAATGVSIFAVSRGDGGYTATPSETLDQTRKLARLSFDGTPARLVGEVGKGWPAVRQMLDLAAIALAAEQVGGAQKVLEMSVEYAKIRVQFGRPIGSFQAIKHKCADMLVAVESAKSAAYYAGWAAAENSPETAVAASLAKSYCSEAYFQAAAENIQIHGGIGFTWEHPAHLYFKRAKSSELLFGDAAYHREQLAKRIGI
ncbi:acyl-CoA dehydrogenase [Actinosynnema sp. ALI-1.44]|uniref:acyl-CoA dehydrogenase family protein n=1 Tax=Actinosynnema sp. ALI-1.44 TaxID=1933779 RepID=UPI00097C1810|nr:acyl-CoA dehydrogenase family protein [Actinosynnema sp. ALI-1.44]ONI78143.1 acyl-CoA dehydrogenase [Actinosynnema sp. ALI-1.44]